MFSFDICLFTCVYVHACVTQHTRGGQRTTVGVSSFLLPPCGFQGSTLGPQVWQQVPSLLSPLAGPKKLVFVFVLRQDLPL